MIRRALRTALVLFLATPVSGFSCAHGEEPESFSRYVPMPDGVRLAVDVHLPSGRKAPVPALVVVTRYWRSAEDADGNPVGGPGPLERTFLEHGYALVKVDARGSGASFGTRDAEYGDAEVRDGFAIVDWIVDQPWSSGKVGAFGTSYTGTTAELLAASGHPAVRAVVPGWSDYDVYLSPVRPYGLCASGFLSRWGRFVGALDANRPGPRGFAVRRVDEDTDGSLRAAAVAGHEANLEVLTNVQAAEFRDDIVNGTAIYDVGPVRWRKEIEEAGVPTLVLASWLDAGTADGALQRFRTLSHPQKLVILATNHGGARHASPFAPGARPRPTVPEQVALRLAFLDHYLKEPGTEVETWPAIRYYNLGEEAYRETEVWPPTGQRYRRWYLGANRSLGGDPPAAPGSDRYPIDFGVSTGTTNRWTTQMGGPVQGLDDRGAMDERMLAYTSEPLPLDLQVTGSPVLTLRVSSDHDDGAFLVYLEDVDPGGRSRYVTEGGLRAIHRKPASDPRLENDGPLHTYRRGDAMPLVPGEMTTVRIRLLPTSVLFRAGHRIRIAIAGADAHTFDRIPGEGTPTIRVERSPARPSFVELPVIG